MTMKPDGVLDIAPEVDRFASETSQEPFDRMAFARRALELARPVQTRVALCEGAGRLRVQVGPVWGRRPERWAVLAIPAQASRRAIALAVAELAPPRSAYLYDLLVGLGAAPEESLS